MKKESPILRSQAQIATATIRISVNIFIFLLQARKTVENLRCATWKMLTHHQLL